MASKKFTELDALSPVLGTDIVAIVDDPGGTPVSKKATMSDISRGWQVRTVQNASASSEIVFTDLDADHEYEVAITDLIPTADNDNLILRVSTDNGVSYVATNSYAWQAVTGHNLVNVSADGQGTPGSLNSYIELSDTTLGTGTGEAFQAELMLKNHAGSKYKIVQFQTWQYTDIPQLVHRVGMGVYWAGTAVDAIQFTCVADTIASGRFVLRARNIII